MDKAFYVAFYTNVKRLMSDTDLAGIDFANTKQIASGISFRDIVYPLPLHNPISYSNTIYEWTKDDWDKRLSCDYGGANSQQDNSVENTIKTLKQEINLLIQSQKPLLSGVYQLKTKENRLSYVLILKDDTIEHRQIFLDFQEEHEEKGSGVLLRFQFAPAHVIDKMETESNLLTKDLA